VPLQSFGVEPEQTQLPEEQAFPVGHTLVQLPQWLLSLPFTLMQPLVPQSVPDEQTQFVAVPEQTFPVPHEPLVQCPLALQVWGTPALHCEAVGEQSAQAFWTQVQLWVLWEQLPWLLQVPAN